MNRVLLIGNGFDLAHGLDTRYTDFINNYWDKKLQVFLEAYKTKNGITDAQPIRNNNANRYQYEDEDLIIYFDNYHVDFSSKTIPEDIHGFQKFLFINSFLSGVTGINNIHIKNKFLDIITSKIQLSNWVDIEEEYYKTLISCHKNNIAIKELNEKFHSIQIALESYLNENCTKIKAKQSIEKLIYSPISKDDFSYNLPQEEKLEDILFLVFNYTPTAKHFSMYRKGVKTIYSKIS